MVTVTESRASTFVPLSLKVVPLAGVPFQETVYRSPVAAISKFVLILQTGGLILGSLGGEGGVGVVGVVGVVGSQAAQVPAAPAGCTKEFESFMKLKITTVAITEAATTKILLIESVIIAYFNNRF